MTSTMRRTVRGTAAGMGALAIIAGTAACGDLLGGGDDEGDGGTGTEETQEESGESEEGESEESADDSAESEETGSGDEADADDEAEGAGESAEEEAEDGVEDADDSTDDAGAEEGDSEESGDDTASGEALSEEDLTAVGDLYEVFLQALGENDGEAACALITNPMNGEPLEGTMLSECAEGFEDEGQSAGVDPELLDSLDRSMIEGVDNGDGTASATLMGTDVGFTFVKADDGEWYIDGSQFV